MFIIKKIIIITLVVLVIIVLLFLIKEQYWWREKKETKIETQTVIPSINTPEDTMFNLIIALNNGDIEKALQYFTEQSKDNYRKVLMEIKQIGNLSRLANEFKGAKRVYIEGNMAKYEIERKEGKEIISYFIYFFLEGGMWKIKAL